MSDVVLPLLAGVKPKPEGQRPALYACENDHDAIDKLKESLEGGSRVQFRLGWVRVWCGVVWNGMMCGTV